MCVEQTLAVTTGTTGAPANAYVPRPRSEPLLDHAVRYVEERHWDVFPGAWLEAVDGVPRCVCDDARCASPGAHPVRADWAAEATGSGAAARRMWTEHPRASVLLPTGRTFDAIEVSEAAGCLALARMSRTDITVGPVTCTPDGRMLFFVLPGSAAKLPGAVRKLGPSARALAFTTYGEGAWVAAPPTRLGTRGSVQWALRPTAANRWLPDAEELAVPLVYACGRERGAERPGT